MSTEETKNTVKANQTWISEDGIEYTVFSVTTEFVTKLSRDNRRDLKVKAYTVNLSIDKANGSLDGKRVHWVTEWAENFINNFKKV